MSSKHNHPQPRTSSLLTSDMGSGLQWAVKGVSQSCEVERAKSSDVRVSSSPGEWIVRKECLVWLLFRIDGRCQFFSEELKRQGGDVCIIECEYSSFSDGWSYPNHGTCSDWQSVSPKTARCLDWWTISSTHYQCNLGKAINFSAINPVPQHQDEVQGWNMAIGGLWQKAPEHWLLMFLGHGEVR